MANQTVTVLEADGSTQTDVEVLGFGRQAAAASKSTAMSTEDKAVLDSIATLVKAEDAAHTTADPGIQMLAVRKDTSSTGIGANGDYVPLAVNSTGHVYVAIDSTQLGAVNTAVKAMSDGYVLTGLPTDQQWSSGSHVGTMTFNGASTSYSAGDIYDTTKNCTSMGLASKSVILTSVTMYSNTGTAEAVTWRLHFYSATPTTTQTDNAAWDLTSSETDEYLGYVDLGAGVDMGSQQWLQIDGINKQLRLASTPTIFCVLEIETGTTVADVDHVVTIHTVEV